MKAYFLLPFLMVFSCAQKKSSSANLSSIGDEGNLIAIGDTAPAVQMQSLNQGSESSITINQGPSGQKVLLEFFTTSCPYCEQNRAALKSITQEFQGIATLRAIGLDSESLLRTFSNNNSVLNVGLDSALNSAAAYGIYGVPTTVIIDENNKVIYVRVGAWGTGGLNQIRQILSQ